MKCRLISSRSSLFVRLLFLVHKGLKTEDQYLKQRGYLPTHVIAILKWMAIVID